MVVLAELLALKTEESSPHIVSSATCSPEPIKPAFISAKAMILMKKPHTGCPSWLRF